ncbi:MAG TPA: hypothetical protein VNZ05_04515 [Solirubrobacteraceae bacterium]|jgi:hypothetical protein|nr:hypothetical protein [Solirubrobacteraceae bacterium]
MATRAIVTSQPDVACYVCGRRLLRGEHPETFLVDGAPEQVCDLCAPRAAHQGWPRGDAGQDPIQSTASGRRGSGLFARLRGSSRPVRSTRVRGVAAGTGDGEALDPRTYDQDAVPFDVEAPMSAPTGGPRELALEAFNSSEYPRRIASLARSLGVPEVSVLLDEDLGLVTIVVAWELCWYRYRIDADDPQLEVSMVAQGRTLEELERAERLCNGHADELGALSLLAAAV